MEQSKQPEEILSLGRKLVAQLGTESSHDVLAHWLSHYLADLMVRIESSEGDSKKELERECVETILKVWEGRAYATSSIQPLSDLKPALQLIEAIASAGDHSWEAYMFRGKDSWHKAGATIYETYQLMTGLLFFQLTREADWADLASWKNEQQSVITIEERELIVGVEEMVNRVTRYYGLDRKPEGQEISEHDIVEKLRDAIARQTAAVDDIEKQINPRSGLSKKSTPSILDEYEEE